MWLSWMLQRRSGGSTMVPHTPIALVVVPFPYRKEMRVALSDIVILSIILITLNNSNSRHRSNEGGGERIYCKTNLCTGRSV
ncbi:hypothetical protein TbgDal_IX3450 [Trypanosoma brucei gambiense DAL972]|uniref:Uncharacterized protein n=3 Tax=Trypanosoma brucei TaxID=5691 RepID=Q38ET0_TRYB2|nr:hypothetical protein TbgDal_IX3450 [Trypanosoma brucei gambiense DAL972]XP_827020.1 hypothetical protein, unlikely [Trypanosoma brucei brucei TREU927]EAN76690.1 hypothetical protein, unlikely [Trypanosoma brucei brucei TREU927]RHW70368.1 hypothetical protein DPX39_090031300 [Trypanosoma brucei equiperdum]CBH14270.1 hypothetical protein TbgDal_IX3450 [Trypanosoma brucei gambiense DAL972]|eukprot:XP_011776540.1 hypothetical protein TbgDal_IX3450 [Trypanosoma brucei gambiense DAL972]